MKNGITKVQHFVGLDVHAETIAVAVAERDGGEVRILGIIPNREQSVKKLMGKLGPKDTWRACYEAGPTGYALYWQMAELGCSCEVVAPTLIPVKAGDRVQTDRRAAERLARALRAGDLTPCGCRTRTMRRFVIWCAGGRRPSRISFGPAIG